MHNMIKLTILTLVLLLGPLANACEPVISSDKKPLKETISNSFDEADLVAIVYVQNISKDNDSGEVDTHFKVLESFKGLEDDFSTGWVAGCCLCQKHFEQGKAYVIYALRPDDHRKYWEINGYGPSKSITQLSVSEFSQLRKLSK
ncbi:hypothetical protein [uncultured Pseudoteredinibacter sp.]|uniref:hypothetical protein n=1 Tax=uncultured Pseudoteredinibacter sp. TaxID=1641701 RepID=UPI002606BCF0|nr:hypothetical protein [uncultured Pseudoteredinibacter sp.]